MSKNHEASAFDWRKKGNQAARPRKKPAAPAKAAPPVKPVKPVKAAAAVKPPKAGAAMKPPKPAVDPKEAWNALS